MGLMLHILRHKHKYNSEFPERRPEPAAPALRSVPRHVSVKNVRHCPSPLIAPSMNCMHFAPPPSLFVIHFL
jgi:hypothetical protein